jgi:two-component system OmpR family response regulator
MKVLLAEDDAQIAQAVFRALQRSGWQVQWVTRGDAADDALRASGFDMVVLDIGLPGCDGLEVLRRLRARADATPVLLLTARDEVRDRVQGLDAGADDYLVKPFDMIELEARLRALSRRVATTAFVETSATVARLGRLSQRADEQGVRLDNVPLDLSPREAGVLSVLLARAGRVASKSSVLQELALIDPSAMDLPDSAVEVIVHRLRRKLEGSGAHIHTVRGFGYLLQPDGQAHA